ncbi:MAG TPA: alpha-amylase family glycosyl hydrolase [Verrucomicrobiae bacterium]|nr:alpha-amylase family glycosyl hydrolase [Verrucomicrobiae bacterium]
MSSDAIDHPLVYEINARCWLRALSARHGRSILLGDVPEEELEVWRSLGFTHIWMMGVWTTGPRSRDVFLRQPDTAGRLKVALPDWREEDVAGSSYALAAYRVPASLGGDAGLRAFREQLHRHGLGLLLDFVPNHVGLDHPWLREHPDWFVRAGHPAPGTFPMPTRKGEVRIAHGKDPNFPPWIDTAQLDFRLPALRASVIEQLQSVATMCDGVRCDMAMLLINDVFARTWEGFPSSSPTPQSEFWADAIAAVRKPGFLFLAEAYWDLEARLQSLGFDFTYDKRVLDFLIERRPAELRRHLLERGVAFVRRCAHFLENHDEPRIAPRLSLEEHRAAALLVLALPGLRLLHDGQLDGARVHVPVHLGRRPYEAPDPAIAALYRQLLGTLAPTAIGRGTPRILEVLPAAATDESFENVTVIEWQTQIGACDLVVVNLSSQPARVRIPVPGNRPGANVWRLRDLADPQGAPPCEVQMEQNALTLHLRPHAALVLHPNSCN